PDRRGSFHHRAAVGDRRPRTRGAGRRSGGGDVPVFRTHRVLRARGRRRRHGGARPAPPPPPSVAGPAAPPPRPRGHPPPAPRRPGPRRAGGAAQQRGGRPAGAGNHPLAWLPGDGGPARGGLPLAFADPRVLLGPRGLRVLWWLLGLIPPRPRRIHFPPT